MAAGTPLKHLNETLAAHGLSLTNMGDIMEQTVSGATSTGTHGERIVDDDFTLLFNAHHEPLEFTVAHEKPATVELDTALPKGKNGREKVQPNGKLKVEARSMVVLRHDP